MLIHYLPPGLGTPSKAQRPILGLLPFTLLLVFILSLTGCCPRVSMVDVGPLDREPQIKSVIVAHRGSLHAKSDIDNSLYSVNRAIINGVNNLEVDVRIAKDGELFLFHDGSLTRSNSYAVSKLRGVAISEIKSAERLKVPLDNKKQITIPNLSEALALIEKHKGATLQLDLKGESDNLALSVFDIVNSHRLMNQVLVQLRSVDRAKLILSRHPKARILIRCKNFTELTRALELPIEAVELERWISSEAIRIAHSKNVLVALNLATSRLDNIDTWQYLASRGVDMMMTDRAAELTRIFHPKHGDCLASTH